MTYDRRPGDPVDPVDPVDDGTRVVERETYVERDRPVATGYVPPAASSNVNVAGGGGGYVAASPGPLDRTSTRLNSSHPVLSYAVFCLQKNKARHVAVCSLR